MIHLLLMDMEIFQILFVLRNERASRNKPYNESGFDVWKKLFLLLALKPSPSSFTLSNLVQYPIQLYLTNYHLFTLF